MIIRFNRNQLFDGKPVEVGDKIETTEKKAAYVLNAGHASLVADESESESESESEPEPPKKAPKKRRSKKAQPNDES